MWILSEVDTVLLNTDSIATVKIEGDNFSFWHVTAHLTDGGYQKLQRFQVRDEAVLYVRTLAKSLNTFYYENVTRKQV